MLLAVLELWDLLWIFAIVSFLSGGTAALRRGDRVRLERIERLLEKILSRLGEDSPPILAPWQDLARPETKISAIKAYREEHGVGLAEAKAAVEEYMAKQQPPS
jgi:hypothetical protein